MNGDDPRYWDTEPLDFGRARELRPDFLREQYGTYDPWAASEADASEEQFRQASATVHYLPRYYAEHQPRSRWRQRLHRLLRPGLW